MPKVNKTKKNFFVYRIKLSNPSKDLGLSLEYLGLSLEDLQAIAQVRGIKDYESMSKDELSTIIFPLKKVKKVKKAKKGKKPKTSFSNAKIKEMREKFNESRYNYSKLKIKEIRENLYKIEKEKNLSKSNIKEIEKNLTEREENLLKSKKYYEYGDSEYRGIRNVRDLFDLPIDKDYYEPILAKSVFDGNYIQYESRADKGKNLSMKRYLKMIRPYLNDLINKNKIHCLERYHLGNKSWVEKTSSEWEIRITIAIYFISSKDSDETRTMHTKSNNVEVMVGSETNEIIKDLFESFLQKYQEGLEE